MSGVIRFKKYWMCGRHWPCEHKTLFRAWLKKEWDERGAKIQRELAAAEKP